MIINTTYLDKEKKKNIQNIVGKQINILSLLTGKIRGSHRMIIEKYSLGFHKFINKSNSLLFGSVEIREKGIMIRIIIKNYETISWLIPYYKLSIFKSKHLGFHSSGQFLKFRIDSNYKMNKKFLHQLIEKKNSQLQNLTYQ